MFCPICKNKGSLIVVTLGAAGVSGRNNKTKQACVMTQLVQSRPNIVVRKRTCRSCKWTWYTSEIIEEFSAEDIAAMEGQFAADPMKMCDHSVECMRAGKFQPSSACKHQGLRCSKHRCKFCEVLAEGRLSKVKQGSNAPCLT